MWVGVGPNNDCYLGKHEGQVMPGKETHIGRLLQGHHFLLYYFKRGVTTLTNAV